MSEMHVTYTIPDDFMTTTTKTEEKWIWVTGYKGMNKDMKCKNDFQYEVGKTYDMDEDDVSVCKSGFHLCRELKDVFNFYGIGSGNRFFEVRALVRERDANSYAKSGFFGKNKKLAAKSIEIVRELTVDEIFEPFEDAKEWSDYIKMLAISDGYVVAKHAYQVNNLMDMGYSKSLAEYIMKAAVTGDGYELAVALNSQPGISMDTKIIAIFSHI